MSQNKKSEFSGTVQSLAEYSKIFSHPARIAILEVLAKRKECICGEIVQVIPLAQATVSQHLKDLKEIGFITGELEGAKSCYCINWEKLSEFESDFKDFFSNLKKLKKQKGECC